MIDNVALVKLVGRILNLDVEVKTPPPKLARLSCPADVVKADMARLGINLLYPTLLDGGNELYHYTTMAGWRKAARYVYEVYSFPKYVPGRKDCDFFALLFVALIQSKFGFNGCGIVYGPNPNAYHSFVYVKTEVGWWLWEPAPAYKIDVFFEPGDERGYFPQHILI